MPKQLALYYGGEWHLPAGGYRPTVNPATQEELANAPEANSDDVDAAVHKAHQGFLAWARVPAAEKSAKLREIARRLGISELTVQTHVVNGLRRLEARLRPGSVGKGRP